MYSYVKRNFFQHKKGLCSGFSFFILNYRRETCFLRWSTSRITANKYHLNHFVQHLVLFKKKDKWENIQMFFRFWSLNVVVSWTFPTIRVRALLRSGSNFHRRPIYMKHSETVQTGQERSWTVRYADAIHDRRAEKFERSRSRIKNEKCTVL